MVAVVSMLERLDEKAIEWLSGKVSEQTWPQLSAIHSALTSVSASARGELAQNEVTGPRHIKYVSDETRHQTFALVSLGNPPDVIVALNLFPGEHEIPTELAGLSFHAYRRGVACFSVAALSKFPKLMNEWVTTSHANVASGRFESRPAPPALESP